jgi:hypothetical protein
MKRSGILSNRLLGGLSFWAGLQTWSAVQVEPWLPEPTRLHPGGRRAKHG